MNRIMALAHITFLNGLRRNAVWGLCFFALAFEICGVFFMDFFGHDLGRVICDFQFSIMWAAGMIFILFYAVQAVAWDDDHRIIDSILARPISRSEYVLGSMAGLSLLLLCFEFLLMTLAMGEIIWIKPIIGEVYFPLFSATHFIIAWLALQAILLTHLGIVILVSSAIRGAFPVMLITLAYSLICSGLPVVRESIRQQAETSAQGLDHLLTGMSMLFPDFGVLNLKDSVLSIQSIENMIGMSVWLPFGLISAYLAIVLLLSCMVYERRDIL
jgi:ABC-type transport system involved in multi-copper enzyme maturation permease subunit